MINEEAPSNNQPTALYYIDIMCTETVFATLWRFRSCVDPEPKPPPYKFDMRKFLPRDEFIVSSHSFTGKTRNIEAKAPSSLENSNVFAIYSLI